MSKNLPNIVGKEIVLDIDEEVCEITSAKTIHRREYIAEKEEYKEVGEEQLDEMSECSESENINNIKAGHTPYPSPEPTISEFDRVYDESPNKPGYCAIS